MQIFNPVVMNSKTIISSLTKVKKYICPLIVIILYFIFSFPLNQLLIFIWDFVFNIIPIKKSYIVADHLISFLVIVYFVFSIYRFIINYLINKNFCISFLTPLFIIYIINRFVNTSEVDFYQFYATKIYYADTIILIFIFETILFIRNYLNKEKDKDDNDDIEFIEDIEWTENDKDILGVQSFAKRLAELILKIKSKNAIGIGIVGKWGEGKSSFINMMKPFFENGMDTIFIDFNPWTNSKAESITIKFFKIFSKSLSPYVHNNFRYYINRYSKSLSSVDQFGISGLVNSLSNSGDTEKIQFDNINNTLSKLDKKIIVVIDNLDRLDNEEIIEVLKIIRNTANFNNTTFIAAYDREYLQQAVSQINPYNKEEYLEKIFTLEYPLPEGEPNINIKLLKEYLIKYLPEKEAEINSLISFSNDYHNPALESNFIEVHSFLPTIRDVKRFINSFILDYRMGGEELHFSNFFFLELFRYKLLGCYSILKKEYFYYLKSDLSTNRDLQLNMIHFQTENFCKYLKSRDTSASHISLSQIILPLIFRYYTPDQYKTSIVLVGKTYRYFSYRNIDSLPVKFLERIQTNNFEDFKKHIDNRLEEVESKSPTIKEQMKNEIHNGLMSYDIDKIDSKDKLEAYFKKLIYISNLFQDFFINTTNNLFTTYKSLKDSEILQKLYGDDFKEVESFIRNEFDGAANPYNETFILNNLIRQYIYNPKETEFFITKEEAQEYCESYFKKYLETQKEVENHTFEMYHCCIQNIDSKTNIVKLTANASKYFKKFILDHPARFIEQLIRPEVIILSGQEVKMMVFYPFIDTIFGNYAKFGKFILDSKYNDIPYIDKIREYWQEYKGRNYKNFVIKDEDRGLFPHVPD